MPTVIKTPGTYIEEISRFPPSVAPVATAIPAFIGYTDTATDVTPDDLHLVPTRIKSLVEYEQYFGLPQPEQSTTVDITITTTGTAPTQKIAPKLLEANRSKHIMYYALQLYFANGGGPCYVVSVAKYLAFGTALVEADLQKGLDAIKKEDEPTLLVFPEAQGLGISDFKALHDAALAQCATLKDRFVIMDVHGDTVSMSDPAANMDQAMTNFRSNGIGINNLKYGAAYAPNIATIQDFVFDETKTNVTVTTDGVAAAAVKLDSLKTTNNAQYTAAVAAIRDLDCRLPPAAAIAGIYASVDNDQGVWKAPANVSVTNVIKPVIPLTDSDQEGMNVDVTAGKSVNAIRSFLGLGTLVWGARTLAGNDNEWRYVNVRRLFIMVEESVKKATQQFVFDANDANTWVKVQAMIENFLTTIWRQGALQGAKPEQAFYVAVGLGKTMAPLDVLEGRLIVEVGMAAVRPAEFIILRFSHKLAEA